MHGTAVFCVNHSPEKRQCGVPCDQALTLPFSNYLTSIPLKSLLLLLRFNFSVLNVSSDFAALLSCSHALLLSVAVSRGCSAGWRCLLNVRGGQAPLREHNAP